MIKNQIKTVMLLGLLTGLLLAIGYYFGGNYGLGIGLAFALLMNFGSLWFSDKIVLRMYRAKEVRDSEYPELHRIVREVSQLAGIPMPKVYIVPSENANAFAVGRDYKHSAVACTKGILDLMNEDELKGVIAHEISHIKNRDTLVQAVAATVAGVISYVAFFARWGALFGGFGRDRDSGNMIELLALAILTPLIATIIQLAISRSREYLADESAAKALHSGLGLASALEKLEQSTKRVSLRPTAQTQATAHIFIINPFRGRGLIKWFSTHPLTSERIKRLRSMQF